MMRIVSRPTLLLATGFLTILAGCAPAAITPSQTPSPTATLTPSGTPTPDVTPTPTATPDGRTIIGQSVNGLPIELYRFGDGPIKLILVGGIHGGYEGNTVTLAGAMVDHFRDHPGELAGLTVLIVPDANPDALAAFNADGGWLGATNSSEPFERWRVNAHGVDLNRNWDCNWERSGRWAGGAISGGDAPFSEPETRALRDLILIERPAAVVFWHSALGAVIGGGCGDASAFDASKGLAAVYGDAAGYNRQPDSAGGFLSYDVTGDASNWASSKGFPALTVELSSHASVELEQNVAGLRAMAAYIEARPWMVSP